MEHGTVIHGTLRSEDLIPAFFAELFALNSERAEEIIHNPDNFPVGLHVTAGRDIPEELREAAFELVIELADALDEAAPDDTYFGTLPGDGSDFGFWPIDLMGES